MLDGMYAMLPVDALHEWLVVIALRRSHVEDDVDALIIKYTDEGYVLNDDMLKTWLITKKETEGHYPY